MSESRGQCGRSLSTRLHGWASVCLRGGADLPWSFWVFGHSLLVSRLEGPLPHGGHHGADLPGEAEFSPWCKALDRHPAVMTRSPTSQSSAGRLGVHTGGLALLLHPQLPRVPALTSPHPLVVASVRLRLRTGQLAVSGRGASALLLATLPGPIASPE